MAATSGIPIWGFACALLFFAATANGSATYSSVASGQPPSFTAILDDNNVRVCSITGASWGGANTQIQLECGSSGYSATAAFGPNGDNGYIRQYVTMSRPGFTGTFEVAECLYGCGCGDDCVTWSGSAF